MKTLAALWLGASTIVGASAHDALLDSHPSIELEEFVVTSPRSLKDIGVQKTEFDSLALKETIALSMADVLTFNSSAFIKSYGRATLSTVSFRGTAPSHTNVTWNGMAINSPMMGMTDFSTIPSFLIDRAGLLHGASSLSEGGGGLGGAVKLETTPQSTPGWKLQYVQGIGSFKTFDEFLSVGYSAGKWKLQTRIAYSSSPNDYKYTNYDKKEYVYDDNHQIIDSYYPRERNRSGAFKDFNVLQEGYLNDRHGNRWAVKGWFQASNRELPLLTTDYNNLPFENRQRENTVRAVASWNRSFNGVMTSANAGYVHTYMHYVYKRDHGNGELRTMNDSRSMVNTFYVSGKASGQPHHSLLLTGKVDFYHHRVSSRDLTVGFARNRSELSVDFSANWQPTERLGLSASLREDEAGGNWQAPIPSLSIEGTLLPDWGLTAHGSVTRNLRIPTLNDLYFQPGGNPDLKSEKGVTWDAGLSFKRKMKNWDFSGGVTWFDSYIDDWILWLPTTKGFFSPKNIRRVHAYGIEANANFAILLPRNWILDFSGTYSYTPSINQGDPMGENDRSVGKQLPYIPRHSASLTGRVAWRGWVLLYKWNWYSRRYTMSSNDISLSGDLPSYFMNNVVLEKKLQFSFADFHLSCAVNNIFNKQYISVLGRPMPGTNFEFFVSIAPKFL